MAVPKTLTTRIQDLINSIGELDRPAIKAQLVRFARLAEALEDGTAKRKTEAKITRLKSALEASKSNYAEAYAALEQSSTEIGNLQSELQTMQSEIAKYQSERTKEEKRDGEMPDIQFEILKGLPNEGVGDGATLKGIAERANVPSYEAAVHLDKLEKTGLAKKSLYDRLKVRTNVWHRTVPGSELILAKRLAGDEEPANCYKHADLPPIQHEILLLIAAGENDGGNENVIAETLGKTLGLIRFNLKALEDADMAADPGLPDYGAGCTYYLRDTGAEYLAERDLL